MSLIKRIERIERMHTMIKFKRTGSPQQFAQKMGLSQSMLYYIINELKEMGAPIIYSKFRESYEYEYPVQFQFGFNYQNLNPVQLRAVQGGCFIDGESGEYEIRNILNVLAA